VARAFIEDDEKASTKVIAMKTGKKYEPPKNETGNRGNC